MAYNSSSVKRARDPSSTPPPNKLPCLPSSSSLILSTDDSRAATSLSLTYEEFKNLDNGAQEERFMIMLEALLKWEMMSKSCPRLDMKLFQLHPADTRLSEHEKKDTDHQLVDLQAKWSLPGNEEGPGYQQSIRLQSYREWASWYDDDLCWNTDKSRFEVCRHCRHWSLDDNDNYFRHRSLHGLFSHMSSQLLLYRLTIYMGRSPNLETDGYKTCWGTKFLHSNKLSILRFWDSKGAAKMEFSGLKASEEDALQLVNLLARLKYPHTYDSVIAGTVA
ncbi:hypothetical protein BDV12DRAFT_179395 [Aspergillus spectabilis]